jgi:hypothetical protein
LNHIESYRTSADHDRDKRRHGIQTTTTCNIRRREASNQSMNRDITPSSGQVPSLEGPGRDKVYLLPPLTLYLLYRLSALEALAAAVHFWVDVCYSILQPLYLF